MPYGFDSTISGKTHKLWLQKEWNAVAVQLLCCGFDLAYRLSLNKIYEGSGLGLEERG